MAIENFVSKSVNGKEPARVMTSGEPLRFHTMIYKGFQLVISRRGGSNQEIGFKLLKAWTHMISIITHLLKIGGKN